MGEAAAARRSREPGCDALPTVMDFGDCDADWDHATQIGERWEFNDLEYLLGRIYSAAPRNVLAVFRNPDARVEFEHEGRRFEFVGCDLVEITR